MKHFLLPIILLLPLSLLAQHSIKGKVQNAQGVPIPGARIILLKTGEITIADKDGSFSITKINNGDSILVSSISYHIQKLLLTEQTEILITLLPNDITLEEVTVSTGYQEIRKDRSTGLFEKVDSSILNRRISTDILSRLDGTVSNLFVSRTGNEPAMFLRGLSSLQSKSSPLVVVDNFPFERDLSLLNPNDVATVTVLKDASATSIWGARAGNGVIVIQTKKGKFNQPLKISINSNITLQDKPRIMDDPRTMPVKDFIASEKFLFDKGYYDDQAAFPAYYVLSPVVELLYAQKEGQISSAQAEAQIATLATQDIRKDYLKYLYRKAITQQQFLSLSAGSRQLSWMLNLGYDQTLSDQVRTGSKRYTLHSVNTIKPVAGLEISIGINASLTQAKMNGLGTIQPGGDKGTLYPYARLADEQGNYLAIEKDYRSSYADTAGGGLLLNWKYRPLEELTLNNNLATTSNLIGRVNVRYKLNPYIQADIKTQLESNNNHVELENAAASYYTRNIVNLYSQITGPSVKRNIPQGAIVDRSRFSMLSWNVRGQLSYDRSWRNTHSLNLITGAEIRGTNQKLSQNRLYGYNPDILTYANIDFVSTFPLYGGIGNAAIPNGITLSQTANRFVSFFGNFAYAYKSRYAINLSARRDASNLFGVSTNQKWSPFWSAGMSWKLSEESFYKLAALPVLSLRITKGFNGNINSSVSALSIIQYMPALAPTNLPYATIRSAPNPSLRWERNQMTNIGIDFEIKDGKISGSIDYYQKRITDLISPSPVDPTTGVNVLTLNAASMKGKGLDIRLNTLLIDRSIRWNTLLLFSYATTKVTKYLLVPTNKGSYAGNGYNLSPLEGKDPYSLISYRWGGLDPTTGNPLGFVAGQTSQNYAGIVNTTSWDDLIFTGTTRPPIFGNWIHSLHWKGITLSASFSYRFKYYFRRSTINYSSLFNSWIGHSDYNKQWLKPGDEHVTSVPSMVFPANTNRDKFYGFSEATIEKGDLVRWQDINVSWLVPLAAKSKRLIHSLSLTGYMNNLGLIWRANKAGLDPEYGNGLPPAKTYALAIKIEF